MPFLKHYDFDVFVSYSFANDAYELDGQPWVRRFVDRLTNELRNRIPGDRAKQINFFYAGKGDLKPGEQIDKCFEQAEKSALFLIIGSPRFGDVWPQGELRSFVDKFGPSERVFIAEMLPAPYPDIIAKMKKVRFHRKTADSAALPFQESKGEFMSDLAALAVAMAERLEAIDKKEVETGGRTGVNPEFGTVLIAQTQMVEEAARLRSHLRQFGVPVLPGDEGFLEEGAAFREEYEAALAQAKIVVQLLGRQPERRTKDIPEGYDGFQAKAAGDREGVRLMQWRDSAWDVKAVTDASHKAMLEGASAMLFEEFDDMVFRAATAPPPRPPAKKGGGFIFIDADQVDEATAREVLNACRERNLPALMPAYGVDKRKDWRENYADADRIAVIYGKSGANWLHSQLRMFMRTGGRRDRDQDCVIYLAPPPPKTKEEVEGVFTHPGFAFIDGTGGGDGTKGDLDRLYARLFS